MPKAPYDSDVTEAAPVGYYDPTGCGWGGDFQLVVYRSPAEPGAYLVASTTDDASDQVATFSRIKYPPILPLEALPAVVKIGDEIPMVYRVPDGRLLHGPASRVRAAVSALLHDAPEAWGEKALSFHGAVEFSRADDLLPNALRAAAAFMDSFPGSSGMQWRWSRIKDAYSAALRPLFPKPEDWRDDPLRDLWPVVAGKGVWIALPFVAHGTFAKDGAGLDLTRPEMVVRAFGLEPMGFANGGERPPRWTPPPVGHA